MGTLTDNRNMCKNRRWMYIHYTHRHTHIRSLCWLLYSLIIPSISINIYYVVIFMYYLLLYGNKRYRATVPFSCQFVYVLFCLVCRRPETKSLFLVFCKHPDSIWKAKCKYLLQSKLIHRFLIPQFFALSNWLLQATWIEPLHLPICRCHIQKVHFNNAFYLYIRCIQQKYEKVLRLHR